MDLSLMPVLAAAIFLFRSESLLQVGAFYLLFYILLAAIYSVSLLMRLLRC